MKKYFIILTLCILCLSGCGKKEITKKEKKDRGELYFDNLDIDESKYLKNCLKANECPVKYESIYGQFTVDTNIDVLKNAIDDLNKIMDKYYEEGHDSRLEQKNNCGGYEDVLFYQKGIVNEYYTYVRDDYIMLGIKSTELDYCNNTKSPHQTIMYIYDRKNDKIITQEEYLNNVGIKQEDIISNVNAYLELNNKTGHIDDLDDLVIFKLEDENMFASYYDQDEDNYISMRLG